MKSKKPWLQAFVLASIMAGALYGWFWWSWKQGPEQTMQQPLKQLERWKAFESQGAPDVFWVLDDKGFGVTQKEGSSPNDLSLSRQKQVIRIVHFWASWCGPCVEELPSLLELAKALGSDQVVILAISQDHSAEDMISFLKDKGLKSRDNLFFIFDDKQVKAIQAYGSERLPESFILDANLRLKKRIAGSIEWVTPQSLEYFKHILETSVAN